MAADIERKSITHLLAELAETSRRAPATFDVVHVNVATKEVQGRRCALI